MFRRIWSIEFPALDRAVQFGEKVLDYLERRDSSESAALQQEIGELTLQLKTSREPLKTAVDNSSLT